ncbi:MFS transporter [Microbacterium sp. zg-Y818]|uniref:MFS transporter n=1 Tax=unclassified Microbacterium TaxID=2609290 RepID=UPI00214C7A67|nr:MULTISPECIES: MFS transporter [unclassified Microbacterium]MCR2799298.1 MFS transporter [Microbacterium sp. zg.Y818]WIM23921.1 MFS transporter [Microbacterium sp. zg-Y818]
MFRSLRARNYRIWFLSGIVSNAGTWVQSTAMNWFILTELTDGDATAVGVALGLQFAPPLLLLPLTGWLPDRFDRRRLILVVNLLMLVLVAGMGAITLAGAMTLQLMFVLCLAFGILNACDIPARQTFVTDLVRQDDVANAIALNSASYNLGRLAGPAVAGALLVAVGAGWAFVANGATYLALVIALLLISPRELVPRATRPRPPRVWGGVRYLAKRPDLIFICASMFVVGAFAINIPLTSSIMVETFGGDAADFGIVNSLVAIGSLAGALYAAQAKRARLGIMVGSFALLTVAAIGGAVAPDIRWYTVSVVFAGFAVILALATANGYVQSTTHVLVRGRVLAAYMAVLMGSSTVGSPTLGIVADTWGGHWSVAVGAVAAGAATIAGAAWLRWGPRPELPPVTPSPATPPARHPLPEPLIPGSALDATGPFRAPTGADVGDDDDDETGADTRKPIFDT